MWKLKAKLIQIIIRALGTIALKVEKWLQQIQRTTTSRRLSRRKRETAKIQRKALNRLIEDFEDHPYRPQGLSNIFTYTKLDYGLRRIFIYTFTSTILHAYGPYGKFMDYSDISYLWIMLIFFWTITKNIVCIVLIK